MFGRRLGCSTISFRHLELRPALEQIASLGFAEIDHAPIAGLAADLDRVAANLDYVLDGTDVVDAPGNINLSVGRGDVDFGAGLTALHSAGFEGHYGLETGNARHHRRGTPGCER